MLPEISTFYHFLRAGAEFLENDLLLGDAERVRRQAEWLTAIEGKRLKAQVRFFSAFKSLRDAIIASVNGHPFVLDDDCYRVFRRSKKTSVLPLFLRCLLRLVLDEEGKLLPDYSDEALEFLLTALTLVKRVKAKSIEQAAEKAAVDNFKSLQTRQRPFEMNVVNNLRLVLDNLLAQPNPTLAFPGPGAVTGRFSNYVPRLTLVNPRFSETCPKSLKFILDCYENEFGVRSFRDLIEKVKATEGENKDASPNFYPLDVDPVCKLVTVDKDVTTKRPITVTNSPAKVSVCASLRVTMFNCMYARGLRHVVNIHDQSISRAQLNKAFMSFLDLKDGSGCFTYRILDLLLPSWVTDVWKEVRDTRCTLPSGEIIDILTGLMGDAAMAAILTIVLAGSQVTAYILQQRLDRAKSFAQRYPETLHPDSLEQRYLDFLEGKPYQIFLDPFTEFEVNEAINYIRSSGNFSQVGDDVACESYIEDALRFVLKGLGVTVNERKSSNPTSVYSETCGGHRIRCGQDRYIRRIYVGRAPNAVNFYDTLLACSEFLQKMKHQPTVYPMTVAFARQYHKDFIHVQSFHSTHIGSPIAPHSSRIPCTVKKVTRVKSRDITDDLSYLFNGLGATPELSGSKDEFGKHTVTSFNEAKEARSISHIKASEYFRKSDIRRNTDRNSQLGNSGTLRAGFSNHDRHILSYGRAKAMITYSRRLREVLTEEEIYSSNKQFLLLDYD